MEKRVEEKNPDSRGKQERFRGRNGHGNGRKEGKHGFRVGSFILEEKREEELLEMVLDEFVANPGVRKKHRHHIACQLYRRFLPHNGISHGWLEERQKNAQILRPEVLRQGGVSREEKQQALEHQLDVFGRDCRTDLVGSFSALENLGAEEREDSREELLVLEEVFGFLFDVDADLDVGDEQLILNGLVDEELRALDEGAVALTRAQELVV